MSARGFSYHALRRGSVARLDVLWLAVEDLRDNSLPLDSSSESSPESSHLSAS